MAIIDQVDVRQQAAGTAPQRQHAEARRDRWMMELERAALPKRNKQEPDAGSPDPRASTLPAFSAAPGLDLVRAEALRLADAPAGTALADTSTDDTPELASAGPDAGEGAGQAGCADAAPEAPSAPAAQAEPQAAAAPVHRAHAAPVQHSLLVAGKTGLAQPGMAPGAPSAHLLAAASRGDVAAQGGAGAPAAGTLPVRRAADLPAVPALFQDAERGAAPAAGELAMPDEAAAADAPAARQQTSEAYARKQLHVYRSNAGVQAWIRDADLNEAQARALVYAMADQLRGAGEKLSALTVNGKAVLTGSDDGEHGAGPGRPDDLQDRQFQHHLKANGAI